MKKNKPIKQQIEKVQTLRPTPDDWNPTLEGGFVTVSLCTNLPPYNKAKDQRMAHVVNVWGGDDTGMQKWFHGSEQPAQDLYSHVISIAYVSKQILVDLGFVFC